MKAIILAAGYATRLYPLTENQPKPLLAVGEKPIVEHIIDKINNVPEVDEIFVVTNNKFTPHFESWLKNHQSQKPIKIINDGTLTNEDRLGAVGDINFVLESEQVDDDLFVIAGDNLFDFSLVDMVDFFKQKDSTVVAGKKLPKEDIAERFGNIIVDENNKITAFEEKPKEPKSEIAATALYLFNKKALTELKDCIKEHGKPDNSGDFIRYLSERQNVYTHILNYGWFDIGCKEHLDQANAKYGGI